MVRLSNVTKKFGSKVAVDQVTLELKPGEIFGFLGPNGAGKTTTIKMIVGILAQDQGEIIVDGIDVRKNPDEAKKRLCFIPDNPDLYETMTGKQYLNFIADAYELKSADRKERILRYADDFEITGVLNDAISSYSHGMRQKLCLIGALIVDPYLFILDEPMVGLDPRAAFKLKQLMRAHCDVGKIVFFSTHVMEVAERLCDRIAIINHGKIVAAGTLEEIRSAAQEEASLEQIFLELTE